MPPLFLEIFEHTIVSKCDKFYDWLLNGVEILPRKRICQRRVVPPGGLEPPSPKAGDFESPVSTNFTTVACVDEIIIS